jgi:hypothetical protein
MFLPGKYDMGDLRNSYTSNFHESFRKEIIFGHKSVVKQLIQLPGTKSDALHDFNKYLRNSTIIDHQNFKIKNDINNKICHIAK